MDNGLNKINHIVVLMMENRSFDNMLGWLYDPYNKPPFNRVPRGQSFDGLSGKNLSNPIPEYAENSNLKTVPAGRAAALNTPPFNPGESYPNVNTQLFGTIIPPGNHPPFRQPYNLPPVLPEIYPMNGFIRDYIAVLKHNNEPAGYENYSLIMDCFTPDMVPVLSGLARSYAVCDRWFGAVPSETWSNRSFLHSGASRGFVNNSPYLKWLINNNDTVFNRMEDAKNPGLTWSVYYDQKSIVSTTLLIHFRKLFRFRKTNFFDMERFYRDASEGNLPAYSFIEPGFIGAEQNDQHPPTSVCPGETLIYNVYRALREGKNWHKTLFIIIYDEHGGCYDHVQPPAVACPAPDCPAGEQKFSFDRLGPRVPAVLVSPYIEAGTVFRARDIYTFMEKPLEHTSVLKTITKRFGLKSLTGRDSAAVDVSQVLTLREPRTDFPLITPLPCPPAATADKPLTHYQKSIVGLFGACFSIRVPLLRTDAEALHFMNKVKAYLD